MSATIPTGTASAVPPVQAQMIVTSAEGLDAGAVDIPVNDGTIPAYYARPARGEGFPVLLVIQEIFGVHAHIQDVCRRLAKLGYLAVAPELYARLGDVSKITDMSEIMSEFVGRTPDSQVIGDLDATLDWAISKGRGDSARMGVNGFCWGGRITWLYCAHNPELKAGVAWYGRIQNLVTGTQPFHPIDIAARLKVPVLGLYGAADQSIPLENIERMQSALKSAHSESQIIVYPDAPHAFFADYRPFYRKEPAEDGWRRMQAWFSGHGV